MGFCEEGDCVGADFVGDITVGGDSIGADQDELYFSFAHDLCDHVVADKGDVDACLVEFPCCEPCALEKGACFVREDAEGFASIVGSVHDGECSAEICRCESASVAVREDAVSVVYQFCAVFSHLAAYSLVVFEDCDCFVMQIFNCFLERGGG